MGTIQHTALIVTSCEEIVLLKAQKVAVKYFGKKSVSGILGTGMNGHMSFFVAPCGSKVGWEMETTFFEKLEKFKSQLIARELTYVMVSYGEFPSEILD